MSQFIIILCPPTGGMLILGTIEAESIAVAQTAVARLLREECKLSKFLLDASTNKSITLSGGAKIKIEALPPLINRLRVVMSLVENK